jgi:hypothetical protein
MQSPISRRAVLQGTAGLAAWLLVPRGARADVGDDPAAALAAAEKSPLVYVSPLRANGLESRCHAEVWFVKEGQDLLVVTGSDRWRAACIARGRDRARLWVGDFGVWTKSEGRFREAPSYVAKARLEADSAARSRALGLFGSKYSEEWGKWGPRFRDGLASGERVLIRYTPVS